MSSHRRLGRVYSRCSAAERERPWTQTGRTRNSDKRSARFARSLQPRQQPTPLECLRPGPTLLPGLHVASQQAWMLSPQPSALTWSGVWLRWRRKGEVWRRPEMRLTRTCAKLRGRLWNFSTTPTLPRPSCRGFWRRWRSGSCGPRNRRSRPAALQACSRRSPRSCCCERIRWRWTRPRRHAPAYTRPPSRTCRIARRTPWPPSRHCPRAARRSASASLASPWAASRLKIEIRSWRTAAADSAAHWQQPRRGLTIRKCRLGRWRCSLLVLRISHSTRRALRTLGRASASSPALSGSFGMPLGCWSVQRMHWRSC
mmetsp:Transcript_63273/g.206462  ORF Transcript_63273/g.206462 Transcript_63273/m.206462 type:complete len:314 (-) Transcript_63273:319-1260(-)